MVRSTIALAIVSLFLVLSTTGVRAAAPTSAPPAGAPGSRNPAPVIVNTGGSKPPANAAAAPTAPPAPAAPAPRPVTPATLAPPPVVIPNSGQPASVPGGRNPAPVVVNTGGGQQPASAPTSRAPGSVALPGKPTVAPQARTPGGPVLPEAPTPIILPLVGFGAAGVYLLLARHRRALSH